MDLNKLISSKVALTGHKSIETRDCVIYVPLSVAINSELHFITDNY